MKSKFFPSHVATAAAVLLCMVPANAAPGAWATWLPLHAAPKTAAWQIEAGPRAAQLEVHF